MGKKAAVTILIAIGLTVLNLGSLILTAVTLPGNWLILLFTCVAAWWRWEDGMFSLPLLIGLAVLALTGEILESAGSALTVKRSGGSRQGSFGGIIGSVVGAVAGGIFIPLPVIGSLLGACIGALSGTALVERLRGETAESAWKRGKASFSGRLLGTMLKLVMGGIMFVTATAGAFF